MDGPLFVLEYYLKIILQICVEVLRQGAQNDVLKRRVLTVPFLDPGVGNISGSWCSKINGGEEMRERYDSGRVRRQRTGRQMIYQESRDSYRWLHVYKAVIENTMKCAMVSESCLYRVRVVFVSHT